MSNLTDLLPAGAGGKQVNFVASGTIGNGVTVALNSDGTVTAVGTNIAEALGSIETFVSGLAYYIASAYDAQNQKIVLAYRNEGNSSYGTAIVGTVSGSTVTFGTPVVFEAALSNYISIAFDSSANKIVITYSDAGNSDYGTAIVGTVSGTSISFGSAVVFEAASTLYTSVVYDSTNEKVVVFYTDGGNSNYGTAIVGTVSGTSISFGTPVIFLSGYAIGTSSVYDVSSQKILIAYRNFSDQNRGDSRVGTVSGTSISFGTSVRFSGEYEVSTPPVCAYDSQNQKIVIAYSSNETSYQYGWAVVGTISGTSVSYGTRVNFYAGRANTLSIAYDPTAKKITLAYRYVLGTNGLIQYGSVTGTTLTFGSPIALLGANLASSSLVYAENASNIVVSLCDSTSGAETSHSRTYQPPYSITNTSFIGITDAAISDTASGSVTIKGGVATNNNLIADSISANTAAAFETGNASLGEQRIVYDTANNKAVVLYADTGNSTYLTAVVGTVSGAAISFGTPVVLQSNEVGEIALAYDANAQKVVAAYKNNAVPFPGRAKVGTVSGTSISFGSAVDFHTGSIAGTDATYDSTSQKVILSYGSSAGGHLIVGTISGTSISFGTEYDFTASAIDYTAVTYDTNAQKVVLAYTDSGNSSYGTAAVGTVSGTSISVGSATVLTNFVVAPLYVEYEPVAQKTVVAYANRGVSPPDWSARVGTVSGTTISFGTETVAGSSGFNGGLTFDTSTGYMIQAYQEASSGTSPVIQISTVSGTDITFGGSLSVSTSTASAILRIAYDPDTSQVIGINRVDSSSSVGRTFNVNQGLTPNSTYYVQSDGTLATTSSTVLAGKALSSTSINLDYTT